MINIQLVIIVIAITLTAFKAFPIVLPFYNKVLNNGVSNTFRQSFSGVSTSMTLDLAYVLICAAFYTLLLVDALLISGRSYSSIEASAIYTSLITLTVTATMLFMWYLGKSEMGIAWWAIVTLILLIIAPNGPFIGGQSGSPNGVNLWIPVLALVFLAVTMFIYSFGHPLDKAISQNDKIISSIVLTMIILIAIIGLGRQYKNFVQNDKRTPNIQSKEVKDLLVEIRNKNWTVAETRLFFAAVSDAHIIDAYEEGFTIYSSQFLTPEEKIYNYITSKLISDGIGSTDANIIIEELKLRQSVSEIEEYFSARPDFNPRTAAIIAELRFLFDMLTNTSSENQQQIIVRLGEEGVQEELAIEIAIDLIQFRNQSSINQYLGSLGFSLLEASELANVLVSTQNDLPRSDIRVNRILNYYNNLAEQDQINFLSKRLLWIHPTGLLEKDQPVIPIPGITAEQRLEKVRFQRINHGLNQLPDQRNALLRDFNSEYPDLIRNKYADDPLGLGNFQPFGPFVNLIGEDEAPELFPILGTQEYVRRLTEQLSLPARYDAYLAYSQYQTSALRIQKERLEDENTSIKIDEILTAIDDLTSDQSRVFERYLIEDEMRDSHFRALLILADEDLSSLYVGDEPNEEAVIQLEADMGLGESTHHTKLLASLQAKKADDEEAIKSLISIENPAFSVHQLLFEDVLKLVKDINTSFSDETQRQDLFDILKNPINIVMPEIFSSGYVDELNNSVDQEDSVRDFREEALEIFKAFKMLNYLDQRNLLHALALDLYQASGEHAHNAFSLIIAQASARRSNGGVFVASALVSSFVFVIAILGFYASRRLTVRDRLRNLIVSEATIRSQGAFALGLTDQIRGRDEVISQLKNLAGRGWSSIGIVGRRGIGKTRVLYELLQGEQKDEWPASIRAWLSAPSKFNEEEFVESVLERLAADVENSISRSLGAKPLEVRRLETNSMLSSVAIYIIFMMIFVLTFFLMSSDRISGQIITSWFPIFLIFILSMIVLALHVTQVQPTDLSPWLERDRSSNPHTVLLYREARQVRQFLDERRNFSNNKFSRPNKQWPSVLKSLAVLSLGTVFIASIFSIFTTTVTSFSILFVLGSGLAFAAMVRLRTEDSEITKGFTLMSLVTEYREFIERMVYRVRKGALGERWENDFEVIVCIDELDKISDPDELRFFLRRMKVILEIPGAYYYLSLSEDALQALNLGAAQGKNEIDSTFDHIVRIPPANVDLATDITQSYIRKNSNIEVDFRIAQMIGAVSFGVPRDIIRRADEVLTKGDIDQISPKVISDSFRQRQAQLAFNEQLFTKKEYLSYSQEAISTINDILIFINDELELSQTTPSKLQVMLSIWVLALLSVAVTIESDDEWSTFAEQLRDIGYRIIDEPSQNLIEELHEINRQVSLSE